MCSNSRVRVDMVLLFFWWDSIHFFSHGTFYLKQVQGLWRARHESMSVLHKQAKILKDDFLSFEISHVLRVSAVYYACTFFIFSFDITSWCEHNLLWRTFNLLPCQLWFVVESMFYNQKQITYNWVNWELFKLLIQLYHTTFYSSNLIENRLVQLSNRWWGNLGMIHCGWPVFHDDVAFTGTH